MKWFLEFLGRASVFIMIIYLMREVFQEQLLYNFYFAIGAIIIFAWMYLPLSGTEDKKQ